MNKKLEKVMEKFVTEHGTGFSDENDLIRKGFKAAIKSEEVQGHLRVLEWEKFKKSTFVHEMPPEVLIKNPHVRELVEALGYYADPDNWRDNVSGHGETMKNEIIGDGGWSNSAGMKARTALKKMGR